MLYGIMPSLLKSIDSLLNQCTVWCRAKPVYLIKVVDTEQDGTIKCHAGMTASQAQRAPTLFSML